METIQEVQSGVVSRVARVDMDIVEVNDAVSRYLKEVQL